MDRGGVLRGVGYTNLGSTRLVYTNLVDPGFVDPTLPPINPPSQTERAEPPDSPARQVFDYWRLAMGKPRAILDRKRQRAINNQLKTRSVDELKRAIDGCKADPFSMGENDRAQAFNDFGLIFRDAEHVEKFLAIADVARGVKPTLQLPTKANPEKLRIDASAERRKQETQRLLAKQSDNTDRADPEVAKKRLADLLSKVGKPVG